jgi:lysine 6-dehydrogenase
MKIAVLGTGLVGGPMVRDLLLSENFEIIAADLNQQRLDSIPDHPRLSKHCTDLTDPLKVTELTEKTDLVISAVPGFMGYQTLQILLSAARNVIDIAFMPEDPTDLNLLALKNGVYAVVDCGVAPGMSNILLANATLSFDEALEGKIMVGGLPVIRSKPWEYKAVFSPADVMEEYTRPARVVEAGKEVVKEPLTDLELVSFEEIGTLEAFVTDGLRSLIQTLEIRNMSEKTLRYPGYSEKIRLLRDSGFLDTKPLSINGQSIDPLSFTSAMLFPKWKLESGEEDLTVMQISLEGIRAGEHRRITWNLFDRFDPLTGVHSMARTTGYTATSLARMISNGLSLRPGVILPETLGLDDMFTTRILSELKKKNIIYKKTESVLSPSPLRP